jgi:Big-like domain-containing protein
MKARTCRLVWLLLGLAPLGACEDETPPITEPPPIKVDITPDTATLVVGAARPLQAVVNNAANQLVTWRSSDQGIASVNAVGLVTGVAVGHANITAIAQEDTTKRAVAAVTVIEAPSNVAITIESIVQTGTPNPVNASHVVGNIAVTANLNVRAGGVADRVEFLVDSVAIPSCTRSFTGTGAIDVFGTRVPIVCDLNTADHDPATGAAMYANGNHVLTARVLLPNNRVGAIASQNLVFANPNFLVARAVSSRGPANSGESPRSLVRAGLAWQSGSITVTVMPVLFQRASSDSIAQIAVSVSTSGTGVSGIGTCVPTGVSATGLGNALHDQTIAMVDGGGGLAGSNFGTTPNCPATRATLIDADGSNGFAVTFSDTLRLNEGGVEDIEEILTFTINSTTKGTQPGPVCINPGLNNPLTGGTGGANCGTGVGIASPPNRMLTDSAWLHDNLAPRFTSLNIRPDSSVEPFFNTRTFSHQVGRPANDTIIGARTVDYGVGRQGESGNAVFLAGTALDSVTEFSNTNTLAESASRYFFQARVKDALNNTRTGTATTSPYAIASARGETPSNVVQIQKFGVDFTKPELAVASNSPAHNSSTANNTAPGTYTLTRTDPGSGPSGFRARPFTVKAELIAASGAACYDLEAGGTIDCAGTFTSDGTFDLAAGVNGYWKLTWFLTDRAGNATAPASRMRLVDATFPVIGAFTIPIIAGGQSVTFNAALSDNVEVKDYTPFTRYAENGINLLIEESLVPVGSYGPEQLSSQNAGAATIPNFLRSIETSAGGLPTGIVGRATGFDYWLRDLLDNLTGQSFTILSAVISSIGGSGVETSWRGAGRPFSAAVNPVASYQLTSTATNICVDSDGDGCTTPDTRLLTATATGPALTFANPFARLTFYYRHPNTGRLIRINSAAATSADNPLTNTRTWTYSVNFRPPPGFENGTVFNVLSIATDLLGRGLASAFVPFTQVAD